MADWKRIETAVDQAGAIMGRKGDDVRTTWLDRYYEKWPHEPGGPTYRKIWTCEQNGSIFPWRPTHWAPLEKLPGEEV